MSAEPKFHVVKIVEPEGKSGKGASLTLDDLQLKGIIAYRYENRVGNFKKLEIEFLVEDLVIEHSKS